VRKDLVTLSLKFIIKLLYISIYHTKRLYEMFASTALQRDRSLRRNDRTFLLLSEEATDSSETESLEMESEELALSLRAVDPRRRLSFLAWTVAVFDPS